MRCPKCGSLDDKVIDSRSSKGGAAIRRRRECLSCGHRFTTYEFVERHALSVVKRDGRTEPFSREKLINSFAKACEKRPITQHDIERCADSIEQILWNGTAQEVSSEQIGKMVMDQLRGLDPVAYVRYASVYRQFQEVGDFIQEIQTLEQRARPTPGHPELFGKTSA